MRFNSNTFSVRISGEPAEHFPICWQDFHITALGNLIIERRKWPKLSRFSGQLKPLIQTAQQNIGGKPYLAECIKSFLCYPGYHLYKDNGGIPAPYSLWWESAEAEQEDPIELFETVLIAMKSQKLTICIGKEENTYPLVHDVNKGRTDSGRTFFRFTMDPVICDLLMVMYAADWTRNAKDIPELPPRDIRGDYRELLQYISAPTVMFGYPPFLPDDPENPWGRLAMGENDLYLFGEGWEEKLPPALFVQVFLNRKVFDGKLIDWTSANNCELDDPSEPDFSRFGEDKVNRFYLPVKNMPDPCRAMGHILRIYAGPDLCGWDIYLSDYIMERLPVRHYRKPPERRGVYQLEGKRRR